MSSATAVATDEIRIADGVALSADYVTKTAAILAQRRKGKTYCASVIAEELVRLGLPWVALDPTGAWWGLRSSADGERAGLPVVVIGGQHGDLPLDVASGAAIADIVLDNPGWYVLDLSLLEGRPAEREFATSFGSRLHRRKMQPGMDFPLHLFVDEADLFVPQEKETRADVPLLAAYQGIIRRGGLHGLGATLISQRPALVNKSVLTQLDLLILLRLVAGNDQDAVFKNYISRATTKEEGKWVMDSLASLPVGDAIFFEPGAEPPLLARAHVRARETFNSSATPKSGEARVEPKVLADVMLDHLRETLSEAIERAESEDPEALRRRLEDERRLRRDAESVLHDLHAWAREVEDADDGPTAIDALIATYMIAKQRVGFSCDVIDEARAIAAGATVSKQRVSDDDARAALDRLGEAETAVMRGLDLLREARGTISAASDEDVLPDDGHLDAPREERPAATDRRAMAERGERLRAQQAGDVGLRPAPAIAVPSDDLTTGAKHLLQTLAEHHPMRPTIGQLALLAKRKARGGAWNTAMKQLRDLDLLREEDGLVHLTDRGARLAGVNANAAPPTGPEYRERWRSVLPAAARELYDVLVRVYPRAMTVEALADETGRKPTGGSWNTALATLARNGLVERRYDGLALTTEGYGG